MAAAGAKTARPCPRKQWSPLHSLGRMSRSHGKSPPSEVTVPKPSITELLATLSLTPEMARAARLLYEAGYGDGEAYGRDTTAMEMGHALLTQEQLLEEYARRERDLAKAAKACRDSTSHLQLVAARGEDTTQAKAQAERVWAGWPGARVSA